MTVLCMKLCVLGLVVSVSSFCTAFQQAEIDNEQTSILAPLVKESLLLDLHVGEKTLVVGARGHILTTDSKPNALTIDDFTQVIAPTKTTLTSVYGLDNNAWAVGHDATIILSQDAGDSWELVQSFPELDRPLLDILFFDNNEGVAVGAYGLFYRTLDGGKNWKQESHASVLSQDDKEYLESIKDDEAFYLEELSFISPHFNKLNYKNGDLYLAGEAGLVAISKDRGKSWERLEIDYFGSFFDIAVLPRNQVLAVGLRGNMFLKDGDEWLEIETCVTTSLNSIVTNEERIYVFGNNGVILKLDQNKINLDESKAATNDGCRRHISVNQIQSNFSDPIIDGMLSNDSLFTVTSSGLRQVMDN